MADDGAPRAAKRARSAPAAGEGSSMVARQAAENAKLGRTGGIYVPPFKLAALRQEMADKDKRSAEFQRLSWEALRKGINGLVNKVNVGNIRSIVPELLELNLVRGRGLLCRALMKAQLASPGFTHIYAALVAVLNTKLPENGELLLKRVLVGFRRAAELLEATDASARLDAARRAVARSPALELDGGGGRVRRTAPYEAADDATIAGRTVYVEPLDPAVDDHDAVRGARDALLGERAEWAKRFRALLGDDAGGDDAAVPRKALDAVRDALATARTADVSRLEAAAETARTRAALEAATAARGAAETRAAAAEARNADLEAGALAWRAERALTRREHTSLKELVATYGDEGDVDAALRARVGELEANLADAARALEAAAAAAAAAPRRAAAAAAEPAAAADAAGEFRVLHLVDNPAAAAAAAHALKKKAAEEARAKADEPKNVVDGAKLHARLKERFREHLSWFREAVYLLTGFKVDMSALGEDNPQVRLRSIFAEDEDDALLFAWGDDGVQLLATPFTDRLDERLFASLKFCNSVPAFLANVQLDLFEKQTLCPG